MPVEILRQDDAMICLIALFVFAVIGIFSAKYRDYFREALNCVFRRATLRKCDTGFDRKMKAKIVGRLMNRNPKIAAGVFRHFEAISWFFTILLFLSMAYSVDGLYNYAVYGNCEGENSNAFCVFNAVAWDRSSIALSDIPLDDYHSVGSESAPVHIVEFGCFQCPYTKAAEDNLKEILEKYPDKVRHTFVYAPVSSHHNAFLTAEAAVCAGNEGLFTEYRQVLFESMDYIEISDAEGALVILKGLAEEVGINAKEFEACLNFGDASCAVQQSVDYSEKLGIIKTPTFYVNGKKIAGVVSVEDVERAI